MKIVLCLLTSILFATPTFAQDPLSQKREFVRNFLLRTISDPDVLADVEVKLSRMESPSEIDALYKAAYQRAYLIEAEKLRTIQAYRDRLRAQVQRGPVGFSPVIRRLPSGTQLGVGAVVSPDRRYVRINVNALFSQFRGLQNFNFGHQRNPFGHHHHHHHR